MSDVRIEHDSMGDVRVPAKAYYGAQTQRAVENFPISGWPLPPALIHALGLVKYAAAIANCDLGKLTGSGKNPLKPDQVQALLAACREVADGKLDDQFPIDVFQTGSGTSSNMNANEVISNRAIELLGGDRMKAEKPIHPNDHVNMGQSTNDMFPTAIHVAVALAIEKQLLPALTRLQGVLAQKAADWDKIIKIGRTHLADATPLRLGQEIGGFARQLELSVERAKRAQHAVLVKLLPAVRTGGRNRGINTSLSGVWSTHQRGAGQGDGHSVCRGRESFRGERPTGRPGRVPRSLAARDSPSTLFNVSNNVDPLAGLRPALRILCRKSQRLAPDRQRRASSIMPGKVNPVMCESMMQVCARVLGNDQAITVSGAAGGQFQLNIMMPMDGTHDKLEKHPSAVRCDAGVCRFLCHRDGGQCRSVQCERRKESVDGHQPKSVHRL